MRRKLAFILVLAAVMTSVSWMQTGRAWADDTTICIRVCVCEKRMTARFTRMAATCQQAKAAAEAAARTAAQCRPNETPCGPVTVMASPCFPHPLTGRPAVEAFAEFKCEVCRIKCEITICT